MKQNSNKFKGFLEHRFYLIQAKQIKIVISEQNNQSNKVKQNQNQNKQIKQQKKQVKQPKQADKMKMKYISKVVFEIGWRLSDQTFAVTRQGKPFKKQKQRQLSPVFSQQHLFPFQKQQVMAIKVKPFKKYNQQKSLYQQYQIIQKDQKDEKDQKQQKQQKEQKKRRQQQQKKKQLQLWQGYALLPLTPFIKSPHTKHQVQVDLIHMIDKTKKFKKDKFATIIIELQFLSNFKASLIISPLSAHLTRNIANVGQMSQKLQFKMGNKIFQTGWVDEGGIKPYFKNQNQQQNHIFLFQLNNVQEKLQIQMSDFHDIFRMFLPESHKNFVGKANVDIQDQDLYKNNMFRDQFLQKISKFSKKEQQRLEIIQKEEQKERKKKEQKQKLEKEIQGKQTKEQKEQKIKEQRQKRQKEQRDRKLTKSIRLKMNKDIKQIIKNELQIKSDPNKNKQPTKKTLQYLKDIYEAQKQDKNYTETQLIQLEQKINQKYKNQIKQYWEYIQKQLMIKNQITLTFRQTNQSKKDKEIGNLIINYLLLKEFQYEVDDSKIKQIKNYKEESQLKANQIDNNKQSLKK